MNSNNKFVVLISGNGSNLNAMCKAGLSTYIAAVISNRPEARGLDIAVQYNIPTHVIVHKNFASRESFDDELIKQIETYSPEFVVLSGFMRILTIKFVNLYKNRLLNIHPSLLPAFIGANAIDNAINKNVKVTGVTVHLVTQELDMGPIIAQGIVPIKANDTPDSISINIHKLEHILYPFVIRKFLNNKMILSNDSKITIIEENSDEELLKPFNTLIFY